jgi:hypothetical protein
VCTPLKLLRIRIVWPAALCACLVGCAQVPLVDSSGPADKLESSNATPAARKKAKKSQPAGDSIPDAAEIGLAPAKS